MARSATQSEQPQSLDSCATLAKSLAPEDICAGDYVAVLHIEYELPSFLWCGDAALVDRAELVRIQYTPLGGGVPLRVEAVCLPFVYVKHPEGKRGPLDVRRHRLARLDPGYARIAWKSKKNKNKRKKC